MSGAASLNWLHALAQAPKLYPLLIHLSIGVFTYDAWVKCCYTGFTLGDTEMSLALQLQAAQTCLDATIEALCSMSGAACSLLPLYEDSTMAYCYPMHYEDAQ